MWEIVGGIGLTVALGGLILKEDSDKKKIQKSFHNLKYGVKEFYPYLDRIIKRPSYDEYVYHVPYGLADDPKLKVIEKTLNKPVHIYFDSKLHIRVYKRELSKRVSYVYEETKPFSIPLGMAQEGMVYHSFDKIPHMTIAGMTRQGKTVLLKLIVAHLLHQHKQDAEIYVIDLKGGLEFHKYRNQLMGIASDVYEANTMLRGLQTQIKSRMNDFKEKEYTNILDTGIKRRTFVIVDEGAELTPAPHHTKEEKAVFAECQEILSYIARIGGAIGYRLVFATQYPLKENLPSQIKQNADAKISFRLPTDVASRVAIDESGAQDIQNVGRAIYRTHEKKMVQVPYISDKEVWELIKDVSARQEPDEERVDTIEIG